MANAYIKLINGIPVLMTSDEIAARQAEELALTPEPTLAERLDALFLQQELDIQAQFAPLRVTIKNELSENRVEIARLIIEQAVIPTELESSRQALLALFP